MRTAPVDIDELAGLAKLILLSSDCPSIAILTGAGVSVASGILGFRSLGGMYDTLRPELITATEQQRRLIHAIRSNVRRCLGYVPRKSVSLF
jgi:NAD-dependent SIR2 family protein deacetylase